MVPGFYFVIYFDCVINMRVKRIFTDSKFD